eukprot:6283982-Prymnesium_polylepis.1
MSWCRRARGRGAPLTDGAACLSCSALSARLQLLPGRPPPRFPIPLLVQMLSSSLARSCAAR